MQTTEQVLYGLIQAANPRLTVPFSDITFSNPTWCTAEEAAGPAQGCNSKVTMVARGYADPAVIYYDRVNLFADSPFFNFLTMGNGAGGLQVNQGSYPTIQSLATMFDSDYQATLVPSDLVDGPLAPALRPAGGSGGLYIAALVEVADSSLGYIGPTLMAYGPSDSIPLSQAISVVDLTGASSWAMGNLVSMVADRNNALFEIPQNCIIGAPRDTTAAEKALYNNAETASDLTYIGEDHAYSGTVTVFYNRQDLATINVPIRHPLMVPPGTPAIAQLAGTFSFTGATNAYGTAQDFLFEAVPALNGLTPVAYTLKASPSSVNYKGQVDIQLIDASLVELDSYWQLLSNHDLPDPTYNPAAYSQLVTPAAAATKIVQFATIPAGFSPPWLPYGTAIQVKPAGDVVTLDAATSAAHGGRKYSIQLVATCDWGVTSAPVTVYFNRLPLTAINPEGGTGPYRLFLDDFLFNLKFCGANILMGGAPLQLRSYNYTKNGTMYNSDINIALGFGSEDFLGNGQWSYSYDTSVWTQMIFQSAADGKKRFTMTADPNSGVFEGSIDFELSLPPSDYEFIGSPWTIYSWSYSNGGLPV